MKKVQLICILLFSMLFTTLVGAQSAQTASQEGTISPAQKVQFEKIIREYLLNNPEILVEASRVLQERQEKAMLEKAQQGISENQEALFNAANPIFGNADSKMVVVEFFDYQCIHCKDMAPVIEKLVESDKNVKVVFKEFPIFGETSEYAARAALAANKQDKFPAFHLALMAVKEKLTDAKVLEVAKQVGLNTDQLKKDMDGQDIKDQLKQNYDLANKLGIMGTPAFILANLDSKPELKSFFIPGATSIEQLQSELAKLASA